MKFFLTIVLAALAGFGGAAAFQYSGLGHQQTREYLVANPEILPQMAEAYQAQEASRRLASVSATISTPFEGAVLGNPEGSKVLVKFTDYACGYCRQSVPDIKRLIEEDPELKVVVREWPIFNGSEASARMSLAAAKQGKFEEFHHIMFELGSPTPENVTTAALTAGIDLQAAEAYAQSEEVTSELARNEAYARQLGFTGTPSWVFEDQAFEGAVGYDRLAEIIAASEEG